MYTKKSWYRRALVVLLVFALPIPAVARLPEPNAPVEQKTHDAGERVTAAEREDYTIRDSRDASRLASFEGGQILYIAIGFIIAALIIILILLLR